MNHVNDVAAVVVTYQSAGHIEALLDSLPAAMGSLSYSVTVVDNGSTDATLELLTAREDCRTIASSNDGYAAGINRAVTHAPAARTVLILNPDATLDPDSVPRMLRTLTSSSTIGIVAPRTREADGSLSPTLRREPSLARVGGLSFTGWAPVTERIERPHEYTFPHAVDWAVGSVLLVDAECYRTLGGMDESYFLYSEETEFCLRARDLGWLTYYTPDAGAVHVGGGSGESASTYAMQQINRIRLYHRRHGRARAWVYYGLTVLNQGRRALTGSESSRFTLRALLRPGLRPPQIRAGERLLPD